MQSLLGSKFDLSTNLWLKAEEARSLRPSLANLSADALAEYTVFVAKVCPSIVDTPAVLADYLEFFADTGGSGAASVYRELLATQNLILQNNTLNRNLEGV